MAVTVAPMNHISPSMRERPRYYANDNSKDVLELISVPVAIHDGRTEPQPPSLLLEGFTLVEHNTAVKDFKNSTDVQKIYPEEIKQLLTELTGADDVVVTSPGILRFGEKSTDSGKYNNSRPARFLHVDIDDKTAENFAGRSAPANKKVRRYAHFNVWRVISPSPQDVPLALCDARTVSPPDFTEADAVFDQPNKPEWSFTGLILKPSDKHRWLWFKDMQPNEAIVFKTNDSDPEHPHCVPHGAFDNPNCPTDTQPRASVEIRAIAYWYE